MGNKDELGKLIRLYRQSRGITQAQLAEMLNCAPSTIAMYETGKREPDMDTIEALADVFNIRKRDLVPDEEESVQDNLTQYGIKRMSSIAPHRVPVLGEVAAGEPIFADRQYEIYVDAPVKADFALTIKGDSMTPTYLDGDVVYIRQQQDIDYDGQVAVVLFDDSVTVKHVYRQTNGLLLTSDNPAWKPMFKSYEDYNNIRILGKICGYTRMYKEN